ncbi:hypothetical protein GTR02_06500 [Kineococcus sp. R8]|uniref:glycosyltransferase family 2 protein n=1 Tax=Kineococcus siccus TaxID=2696567 RepID=UPI0014120099|nr:hypothetical protein [Kineococcus siccus]NAZ81464.1 hypothetical protein [Kineococcus siccus]
MLSILLPAARRSTPEDAQTVWGDLRVALASVAAYAPGVDVVVGWSGRERPEHLPPNPHVRLLEQAEGITTGSDAWNWCARQTDADELLILGDDCVLHPDSLRLLLEDVAVVAQVAPQLTPGFVGARSNYVKGVQNVRHGDPATRPAIRFPEEDQVLIADMVVPVAAWIRHETFDSVGGFPSTNWFADDLICFDLAAKGFTHFVSRSYVHHVGQRATGQGRSDHDLWDQGMAWLRENRPDFLREKMGIRT